MKPAAIAFAVLVLFVLVVGAGGAWVVRMLGDEVGSVVTMQEHDNRKLPVAGVRRLVVRLNRGEVRLHADAGILAELTAVRVGVAKSQADALTRAKQIVWTSVVTGDILKVEAEVPQGGGVEELGAQLNGGTHQLSFDLYVPAGIAVDCAVGTGNVWLGRASAPVRLVTGTGDVTIEDAMGDVEAVADTGSVTILRGRGATAAKVTTGDVRVENRPGPRLAMSAETGDLDWVFPYEAPTTSRLETKTGGITLSVGTNANVALELEAVVGQITDLTKLEGTIRAAETGPGARASLVAGKPTAKLGARTSTGSILVEGPRGVDSQANP